MTIFGTYHWRPLCRVLGVGLVVFTAQCKFLGIFVRFYSEYISLWKLLILWQKLLKNTNSSIHFQHLCLDIFDQNWSFSHKTGQKFTKTDLFPLASVMVKVAQRLSTRINDDFMAHCGSKWLKPAKKLVLTCCDFTPKNSSKCQLISVSGHCIAYWKFVRLSQAWISRIFESNFWRIFTVWPNCVAGRATY